MHLQDERTDPGPATSKEFRAWSADRVAGRLWLVSDLQMDQDGFEWPEELPEFDALVVAGGVGRGLSRSVRRLAESLGGRQGERPVVLVPGALEYSDGVPVPEALSAASEEGAAVGITVLSESSLRIGGRTGDGIVLIGTTLWPAFDLDGEGKSKLARGHARNRWSACRQVRRGPDMPMLPHDMVGAHHRARAYVEDALTSVWVGGEGHARASQPVVPGVRGGDRAVVVSAFPPSRSCLPPSHAKPLLDPWSANWRASDLDKVFGAFEAPAAWLHGSVPYALDVRLGRTRVVANPRGADATAGFDPRRTIAV